MIPIPVSGDMISTGAKTALAVGGVVVVLVGLWWVSSSAGAWAKADAKTAKAKAKFGAKEEKYDAKSDTKVEKYDSKYDFKTDKSDEKQQGKQMKDCRKAAKTGSCEKHFLGLFCTKRDQAAYANIFNNCVRDTA